MIQAAIVALFTTSHMHRLDTFISLHLGHVAMQSIIVFLYPNLLSLAFSPLKSKEKIRCSSSVRNSI